MLRTLNNKLIEFSSKFLQSIYLTNGKIKQVKEKFESLKIKYGLELPEEIFKKTDCLSRIEIKKFDSILIHCKYLITEIAKTYEILSSYASEIDEIFGVLLTKFLRS